MNGFLGYLISGQGGNLACLLELAGVPANPDANPTFVVYGQAAIITSGNGTLAPLGTGVITLTTGNGVNPIVVTSTGHGQSTGTILRISAVGGNTAANGLFSITVTGANTFTLPTSGNGAYTSGGLWKTAGLYTIPITGSMLDSMEPGGVYTVVVSWLESSVPKVAGFSFGMV